MTMDTLIRGGRVVDGTGNPWFYADVAISGDRIVDVAPPGSIPRDTSGEVVDATNHVVCPGFIDILSHSIVPLMLDPRCLSKITQGVTTEIMGEGWTPAPFGGRVSEPLSRRHAEDPLLQPWVERIREWRRFGDWLSAFEDRGVSPNVGGFLGGGRVREYVKGLELGPATAEELAQMQSVAEEAMEDGAFGVSFALIYPPDAFVSTDELVAICRTVGRHGGIYATHVRSETDRVSEAVEEAIEIGRQAAIPVEIYHLKVFGAPNWAKMAPVIERIDRARSDGIDITVDMYPYTACGTGLTAVLPPWASADGKLFENLKDPAMRARIRGEALHPSGDWEAMGNHAGPESIMPVLLQRPENRRYAGKRMADIAASRNQEWIDAVMDLLIEEEQRIETVYFGMSEDNLRAGLQKPWTKISTDAGGVDPAWAEAEGPTHPRGYGTYPRVLGKYVREERILTLEDAVRKMSGAVAARLRIPDRGRVSPGCFADLVVFDPQSVGDRATFEQPHQLSTGIRDVWVNGERVLAGGDHTGATPGRVVRPFGA
jgi:N-acyl-D-amino-acid deacylase